MKISTSIPNLGISKIARAPAGMRCLINNEWNLVTHRGHFHNGETFVVFQVARHRFSIAYGNVANIVRTTKPLNTDPVFVYEHFLRWRKAATGIGMSSSQERYLIETEYSAKELQLSVHLLDEAEKFIKELKRRPKKNFAPSVSNY